MKKSLIERLEYLEKKLCCKTRYFDTFVEFPEEGVENILYVDKATGSIYIWNGTEYIVGGGEAIESKLILNDLAFTPLDVQNPTNTEVEAWVAANVITPELENGTQLVYFVTANGSTNTTPDYTWTLNEGVVTLSDKRTYNSKKVYVDAGSGSDITGKRGYLNFPFRTLNAAFVALQSFDTLHIFPGDYGNTIALNKHVNIYCEDGVNWHVISNLFTTFTTPNLTKKLSFKFDYIYKTIFSTINLRLVNNCDIIINKVENLAIEYHPSTSTLYIKEQVNANVFTGTTLQFDNPSLLEPCNVIAKVETAIRSTSNRPVFSQQGGHDSKWFYEVSNYTRTQGFGQVIVMSFNTDIGINKTFNIHLKNIRWYGDPIYTTMPALYSNPYTGAGAWSFSDTNKCISFFRSPGTRGIKVNYQINNFEGNCHGLSFMLNHSGTKDINIKMKGNFAYGVPVAVYFEPATFLASISTDICNINIELDVVCAMSPAVYFAETINGLVNPNVKIQISGKVETKGAGIPAIVLGHGCTVNTNYNNCILLKDLLVINDGTVPSIEVGNSAAYPQGILIQNVATNALTLGTGVIEVGEPIKRNVNYK